MSKPVAHLVSCNVGKPVRVNHRGREVLTSIFKAPVEGPVHLSRLNLAGDQQADLTVHGGFEKAVYVYSADHYSYWRHELSREDLPWGMFGENFTIDGGTEPTIGIGDRFQIGSAIVQVTQPRMPCFKLALKFGRPDMVKLFWASGRSGFYLSVLQEGEVRSGDPWVWIGQADARVTVSEVLALYRGADVSRTALERALATPLSGSWKRELRERLSLLTGHESKEAAS